MIYREVTLDFETASNCDLREAGAARYAEDPTTEIICLRWRVKGEPTLHLWTPGTDNNSPIENDALWQLVNDPTAYFICHSAGFEKNIWRKIMVPDYGWPNIPNRRWHDTQAVCAMKGLPLDLEEVCAVLELPHQKDMEGSKITKSLSKTNKHGYYDRSPAILERVYTYCGFDINAEEALHDRIGWLPPGERDVWLLDQRMNERGVKLDLDYVRAAQEVVTKATPPLLAEFRDITGIDKLMSPKLKDWLASEGVHLPNLRKETITQVLGSSIDGDEVEEDPGALVQEIPDHVRRVLEIKQLIGSSSVTKLQRMLDCVCEDGRVHGILQYHGAVPGLWSGRLFQPQNFPRGTVQIDNQAPDPQLVVDAIMSRDPEFVEMCLGVPPVEAVVHGLRHAIIAEDDRILVSADLSGIQARLVLAVAGQFDILDMMVKSDVYLYMAEDIYGVPHGTYTKKANVEERQIGKNTILGCGFRMGARTFHNRYCKHMPFEFAEQIIRAYRKKTCPLVPRVWYALEDAATRTVWDGTPHEAYGILYQIEDIWLTARLPSGRKIWYAYPERDRRPAPWDPTEIKAGVRFKTRKNGRWITVHSHGGLWTENVIMGMQRDLMVEAMLKCEAEQLPMILNVHDENVAEPLKILGDPKKLELTLSQIMCDIPSWARELKVPVNTEGWVGQRYKK